MKTNPLEVELKFILNNEDFNKILKTLGNPLKTVDQENFYYDSAGRHLSKGKIALRLRRTKEKFLLSVKKSEKKDESGAFIREELEADLSLDEGNELLHEFKLSQLPENCVGDLIQSYGDQEMELFVAFTTHRHVFDWQGLKLELDQFKVKEREFFELEIETHIENLEKAKKMIQDWFEKHGWKFELGKRNKLKQAMEIYQAS